MATEPTLLTIVFSPNFGAVHWDRDSESLIRYRDENLAGRQITFNPVSPDKPLQLTFEIGRHPDCWIKIGWERDRETGQYRERRDNRGYPIMNYYPRITLTFQWMDANEWRWIGQSAWFVIPGGMFVNQDGIRERSGRNLDLYLNGRLATSDGNPEPLFSDGANQVCLTIVNRDIHERFDAPYSGKMVLLSYQIDQHTTGWPASVWNGPNWPEPIPPTLEADGTALKQQADVELAVANTKLAEPAKLSPAEKTGRTWADVAAIALHGPDSIRDQIWHRAWLTIMAGFLVLAIYFWKR